MDKEMITCKSCGQEIAKNADSCPHCGEKNNAQISNDKEFPCADCKPEMKGEMTYDNRRPHFRFGPIVIVLALLLTGFFSVHFWTESSCTEDSRCKLCGKIRITAPGHQWSNATCTSVKTCKVCGETEGAVLEHDWKDATCVDVKTCRDCGKTEGTVLEHDWKDATCTQPATCVRCGKTTGLHKHTWTNNSTDVLKTCVNCMKEVEFFYSPQNGELLAWTEYEKVNNVPANPVSYSARDEKRLDWDLTGEDNHQANKGDGVHLFYVNGKMYYFDRDNRKMDQNIARKLAAVGSGYVYINQYLWDEDDTLLSVSLSVATKNGFGVMMPNLVGHATAVFDINGNQYVIVRVLDTEEVYVARYNWAN